MYYRSVVADGGLFFLGGVFLEQGGLSFNHPFEYISSKRLLSSRAILSGRDVNSSSQKQCMPSWPGVFQFPTFLSIALKYSRCIISLGPFSIPYNSFSILFIHLAFLLCYSHSYILLQNSFATFASGSWYVHVHSSPRFW